MKPLRIAIIGAGTAGLATANFLSRQSHHITIFEKAQKLEPVGAGLLLQPTGLNVFNKLGLIEKAYELGAPVSGLTGKLPNGKKIVNSFYRDAKLNHHGLGIHRATLCHILAEPLKSSTIRWNMGCQVLKITQKSHEAILHFSKEERDQQPKNHTDAFDLVLICNGAKSRLRPTEWLVLDKPYPWGALWAILPECTTLDTNILHQYYDSARIMMGVLPTGSIPSNLSEQKTKLSSVFWSLPSTDIISITPEEKTQLIIHETQKRWEHISEWLQSLSEDITWLDANYRDVVMRQYGQNAIGVLGDAAHAMSPQLGQGANMALLDAWAISEAIATSDNLTEVWQRYHAIRVPSIRFYQYMSRLLTPFYQSHSKTLGKLRDTSFSLMHQLPWLRKQMALTVSGVKTGLFSEMDLNIIDTNK